VSALRTWLRRERAREYADRVAMTWSLFPSIIREPNADRHIHGRDCEWRLTRAERAAYWETCRRLTVFTRWQTGVAGIEVMPRTTCGVEGEYP
jgi:hypothetical protein